MDGDPHDVKGEIIGINPDSQQPKPINEVIEQNQEGRSIIVKGVDILNSTYDIPVEVHGTKIGNRDIVESSLTSDTTKDVMASDFVEDVAGSLEEKYEKVNVVCNMQGGDVNGPIVSKPKSTWTRIVRMDFELGNTLKAADVPVLGKRVSTQNTNLSMQRDEEEIQKMKREKVGQDSNEILARVGKHPCREQ